MVMGIVLMGMVIAYFIIFRRQCKQPAAFGTVTRGDSLINAEQ